MIRCSHCQKGKMVEGRVENYDASDMVGLASVVLLRAPALVCDRCGHVMFEGKVVEAVTNDLARLIVRQGEELRPAEIRFLREILGMMQAELSQRKIDVALAGTEEPPLPDHQQALAGFIETARAVADRRATAEPYRFRREELYDERESRWTRPG
jgi:YgiT-type zinc finger domain-containing protein